MPFGITQLVGTFGAFCLLCPGGEELAFPVPAAAWTVQTGAFYSSFQRRISSATGYPSLPDFRPLDGGDTTPHGLFLEVGRQEPPAAGGVGSPGLEIAAGMLVAPTHNEAVTGPIGDQPQVAATGNGRFESLWLRVRLPLGPSGSFEAAVDRPYFTEADVFTVGTDLYFNSYKRNLLSDVRNVVAGYRLRGEGWEAAVRGKWTSISTGYGTGYTFLNTAGKALGGEADGAVRFGEWRLAASFTFSTGTLSMSGGFYPDFAPVSFEDAYRRTSGTLVVVRRWDRFSASLGIRGVRSQAPFWDAGGFTDSETYRMDEGRRLRSVSDDLLAAATVGWRLSPNLWAAFSAEYHGGSDTTTLEPVTPGLSEVSFDSRRVGWSYVVGLQTRLP
jgi:hypothetical protein